jgi:hypothetical protein
VGAEEGLFFQAPQSGLVLDAAIVRNVAADGIRFAGPVVDSLVTATVEDAAGAGVRLTTGTDNVAVADSFFTRIGGDAVLLEGPGHSSVEVLRSVFADIDGRGVGVDPAITSVTDLRIEDNTFDGTGGEAIELRLDAGAPSDTVLISRNTIRDFAREPDVPGDQRGIEISGAVTGDLIVNNSLEDLLDQALSGIYRDGPGDGAESLLCTNSCLGSLGLLECIHVVGNDGFQKDSDADQIVDACDVCVDDPSEDTDGDGTCASDNCPVVPNPDQQDTDADGRGDVCDNCPWTANSAQADQDGDEVGDLCDNCWLTSNTDQADLDVDGEGDPCDLNDGLIYVTLPDPGTIEWQDESGFDSWNLYRGDLDVLLQEGLYTQREGSNGLAQQSCGLTLTFVADPDEPAPGKTAFYLVTGVNADGENGLAVDGNELDRPNDNPCFGAPGL